jgi:hypothetical protein
MPTASAAPSTGADLTADLDRLSLEQALQDFEVANARVLDLTQRLVTLHQDNVELARELEQVRTAYAAEKALWDEMRQARAFKLADRIWALRGALKI